MARNKVQLQKGLCETDFDAQYGSEERCHAALVKWRWPEGFECPDCSGKAHCVVTRGSRQLFQCNACRKQTSVRAGTIFAASKLPLRLWFKAIYHLTQSKQGMSSIELSRRLGITQTAAWKMKHKLAQVMLERNATKRKRRLFPILLRGLSTVEDLRFSALLRQIERSRGNGTIERNAGGERRCRQACKTHSFREPGMA